MPETLTRAIWAVNMKVNEMFETKKKNVKFPNRTKYHLFPTLFLCVASICESVIEMNISLQEWAYRLPKPIVE